METYPKNKIRLLYIFHRPLDKSYFRKDITGKGDTLMYGYNFFTNDEQFATDHINKTFRYRNILVDKFCTKIFFKYFRLGFKLGFIIENLKKINGNEIVYCTAESALLPTLFLKKIKAIRNKVRICGISVGLLGYIEKSKIKIWIARWLLKEAEMVLVYSLDEANTFRETINLFNVKAINPGVDVTFFDHQKISSGRENLIVAIGNDSERDFDLLIRAWEVITKKKLITNFMLIIITDQNIKIKEGIPMVKKIKTSTLTLREIRDLYAKMSLAVVPLKKTKRTSGLIAIISILAMNKPVVTPVMAPGIQNLNLPGVVSYEAEKLEDLCRAIEYAITTKINVHYDNKNFIKSNYSTFNFYKQLKNILNAH